MKEFFRDGNWRLVDRNDTTGKASIQHLCGDAPNNWWYFMYEGCVYCGSTMPPALLGLQVLHNWER